MLYLFSFSHTIPEVVTLRVRSGDLTIFHYKPVEVYPIFSVLSQSPKSSYWSKCRHQKPLSVTRELTMRPLLGPLTCSTLCRREDSRDGILL